MGYTSCNAVLHYALACCPVLCCAVIGAALGIREVQVWKDVDGVLTSDPRIVDGARPVPVLTYEEATELAFFGATVLHPQVNSLRVTLSWPKSTLSHYPKLFCNECG